MTCIRMFAMAAALALLSTGAYAQGQDFSQVQIKTTDLGHNTYWLEGQGGNITIAVGGDGIIQVDGQFAPLHDKIAAAVAAVSRGQKVKFLVNTHFHGDHTGGNENFAKDGIVIVSHANVAKRLASGTTNGLSGAKTPPAPAGGVPTKTYTTEGLQLMVQGRTANVMHPLNAHTDGDSYVYFPDADVIATGDIVSLGNRYPTIDYANGGSINGIISAVETYVRLGTDQTKYVPGHGAMVKKAEMMAYRDMLVDVRDRIAALIKEGKTEDQAVAARPLAAVGAKLGTMQMADDNMVRMVFRSLTGRKT